MINKHQPSMLKTPKRLTVAACAAAIAAGFQSIPALAQDGLALEEVIVTATRRSESLQDVAVSVAAITKELRQAQVRRLEDIATFSPSVYIRRSPGTGSSAFVNIRGVGASDVDKSLDPPVGVILDGMFLGTVSGVLMQNFDIERVEILRGPQGTLFGKNTTGGIVNIIRGDVTMDWGGDFSMAFDEHGREDIKGVVNVPLIEDTLGIKLFGAQIKSDGWMYNTTLQEDVGGDDIINYGFAMKWQPTDSFNLKVHYERMEDESDQGAYVNSNRDTDFACLLPFLGDCARTSKDTSTTNSMNGRNFSDNKYDTTIVTANWEINSDLQLTYIGGFRDQNEQNMQHFDAGPADWLDMNYFNDWEQTSHEVRLTSSFDGPFNFVAGLYSFDVDYVQRWDVGHLHYVLSLIGAYPGPLAPTSLNSNGQNQETESIAGFVSMDYAINDSWTLTVGGRYTREEKDFIGGNGGVPYDPAAGDPIPELFDPKPFAGEWSEFTPSASLRWQINDDMMLWTSYAEGFKSGGFFGRQADFNIDPTFEPEYVKNYELGLKSTWLDGRLTFNPTIFLSDYEEKQESILIPVSLSNVATVVRNASTQEIFGVELEMNFQITQNWSLRANYGYIDAEYDNYFADIVGDGIITDNSDLIPRNTPENTFGVITTYNADIGGGTLQTNLSYRYRDTVEIEASNADFGHMDSINDLSGSISYLWSDNRYRVTVYGKNLTDDQELARGAIAPLTTRGWWTPPRTIGAEFAISF